MDDSHLTAVVPFGAGSADVTVQSGIDEADPNNASDNVNAPIFRLWRFRDLERTDKFTFISQTISSTNSTVWPRGPPSFATGSTDTLTITVADTSGLRRSMSCRAAFQFTLTGGTSSGSIGVRQSDFDAGRLRGKLHADEPPERQAC